jgi:hypothetical protein
MLAPICDRHRFKEFQKENAFRASGAGSTVTGIRDEYGNSDRPHFSGYQARLYDGHIAGRL